MEAFNPADEMLRLAELYRQMSDGELLKLARNPSELTEAGQQTLAIEMSLRQLKPEPVEPALPPPEDPDSPYAEDRELVRVTTVWCVEDALRVQYALDVAGIPFYMGKEKATGVDGVTSNFVDGIDVQVMRIGSFQAQQALKDYEPSYLPESEKEQIKQEADMFNVHICCPKCKSEEIILGDTISGEPVSTDPSKFEWTCAACGNKWKDEGIFGEQQGSTRD